MSDYKIPFNNLEQYIPPQMQNVVNVSMMKNLFDKIITHDESVKFYGVIGDKGTRNIQNRPFIQETTTDRFFNSLSPAFYYKIGAEEVVFTFKDLLNKAETMGIDVSKFDSWGQVGSFNFVPPIEIDKFVNFSQYYWIQNALPYHSYDWNPDGNPEYYVIAKPQVSDEKKWPVDVATTGPIYLNGTLQPADVWTLTFSDATHFSVVGDISGHVYDGVLVGGGLLYPGTNEQYYEFSVPGFFTFNLMMRNIDFVAGDVFTITLYPLSSKPASINYSGTGNGYLADTKSTLTVGSIDGVQLKNGMRVLVKDQLDASENGIYIVTSGAWAKSFDNISYERVYVRMGIANIGTWELDSAGLATWLSDQPNLSIWEQTNFWVHEDDLALFNLTASSANVTQALRPIVEYDNDIELSTSIDVYTKIKFNQAPLFSLYDYNSTPILVNGLPLCSAIFYYKEDASAPVDKYLQRRVKTDNFNFIFEQGLTYQGRSVFFKKGNNLATIWRHDTTTIHTPQYVKIGPNLEPIPYGGDPALDLNNEGDWLTPFQLTKNPEFESKSNVSYGDFYSHLSSIISAQPGLVGSPFNNNNYRNLTPDLGVGGTINLIDNQFNLFAGLLNQKSLTPITLIDFAEQQYKNGLSSIVDFTDLFLGEILTKHVNSSNFIADVLADYKTWYASKIELQGVYDAAVGPIPNWPLTLPALGVVAAVQPSVSFNNVLFTDVIIHHDGHQSALFQRDLSAEQLLTSMQVVRFDGTTTTGTYGPSAPSQPYKGQLWFDSANQVLKTFVVDVEGPTQPINPTNGMYWYDRTTDTLKVYNSGWSTSVVSVRWATFSISTLYTDLTLAIEHELYAFAITSRAGQPLSWDISNPTYNVEKYLAPELSKFSIANGLDPYGSNYVPTDAFTWNYGQCSVLQTTYGISVGTSRWNTIYKAYLGTERPDLEPWVILGLPDLATLQAAAGATPIWDYIVANTSKKICVDPTTGILLPPYVSSTLAKSAYALITNYSDVINPTNFYTFGQGSLVETVWRNTVDFKYAQFRASLKADPINCLTNTWGFQTFTVGGLKHDKITKRILSHKDFTLHSEVRTNPLANPIVSASVVAPVNNNSYTFDLTVTFNQNNQVILSNWYQGISVMASSGALATNVTPLHAHPFGITIIEQEKPLLVGDVIRVQQTFNQTTASVDTVCTFIPTQVYVYNGLNQLYVNLKKYNGLAITGDHNDYALRKWTASLIYRTNYLIDTESLSITMESDGSIVNSSSYDPFLKINTFAKSSWVHALRIQIVQIGSHNSKSETIHYPSTNGSDWVFRIENYFPRYTSLTKYNTDTNGTYVTFNALNNQNTALEWRNYIDLIPGNEKSVAYLPINITGIQNVVTFLNEYIMYVTDEGWVVGQGDQPEIDIETGRTITWQLEVEKFIDTLYKGVSAGGGIVINPFLKNVWFNTPTGLVSNFNHYHFDDITTGQLVYDMVGDVITPSALTVVRQDEQTLIKGDVPMFGAHITVNEYEHIIIFKNYNWPSLQQGLLYDQFLGIKVKKLLLKGKRQSSLNNRPTYGGFYLNGNTTSKNVAASIDDVANYYYSDATYDNPTTTPHALALFGFSPKAYFSNLNVDPRSEFNFWRGMITSKGSNYSFDAFINSAKFETAKIDEFWAYKVAEYGDAREKNFPELKVESTDCLLKHTRLFFAGKEQDTPTEVMTTITNEDEGRWFAYSDLKQDLYFSAKTLNPYYVSTTEPNQLIELPFLADEILIFDAKNIVEVEAYVEDFNALATIGLNPDGTFKRAADMLADIEAIEAIIGNDSDIKAKVQIVNNTFLYILVPGDYTIIGYTPMRPKYSPIQLYDYASNVFIENISVWHPLYNYHTPEALQVIDIVSPDDPTRYNYSVLTSNNPNYDPSKCWGPKNVGTVWWDTADLDYIPYSDKYIYPSFEERLIRWGSLAEYAKIKVYEWVNSSVPPNQYDAQALLEQGDSKIDVNIKKTGTAARKELYKSTRTWQGRPVAWSYTANPSATEYVETLTYAVDILYLSTADIGPVTVVLENGTFAQRGLTSGMSIGGWIVNKPYGELVLSTGTGYFLGTSQMVGDTSITFPATSIFSHFIVNFNTNATNSINVGQIRLDKVQQGSNYYLTATNEVTDVMQSILIVPVTDIPGTELKFNFDKHGITISAYVVATSADFLAIVSEFTDNIDLHIRNYQTGNVVIPFNSTIMDNTLPVVSPDVYFDTLDIDGLINIGTINVSRNRNIVGNYVLESNSTGSLSLYNNGYLIETIAIPAIAASFSLVFDIFTIEITMTTLTSMSNFISEFLALLSSMTVGYNGTLVQFVTQDPNVTTTTYNWRAWSTPTQADLTADKATPFASWNPIFGDWTDLPPTKNIVDAITAYNKAPLVTNSGGTINKFHSVWSEWSKLSDELQHQTSVGSLLSFTMATPITPTYLSLYVNGINQLTSSYTLDPTTPTVVTLNSIIPVGNKVTAYLRKYEPTTKELAFDPDTLDVPSTMVKYKYDYEYVTQPVRDSSGAITGNTYYFWVEGKSIAPAGNAISSQEAAILLTSGPSLYMTFQDLRIKPDNGYETIKFFDMSRYEVDSLTGLQMLYKAVTIANLGTYVTKDKCYKLRFTRDFTLRDDPNELDLKNTHTEWALIRPNAKTLIPETLWNLVVDSACGEDIIGNVIPNPALVDYDERHGTKTQYGFGPGQILIEQSLVLKSLMQAITNPKTTKWVNQQYIPDRINTIDYATQSVWFSTPQSTRQLLTQIWTTATPAQINGIFFEVLEDALANDYTFTDLFKTSRISAHSITTNA